MAVQHRRPLRTAELRAGRSQHDDARTVGEPRRGRPRSEIVEQTDHCHDGRGVDVGAPRFVVEAHIATDDRQPERFAGLGDALHHFGERPHHLGMLGIAEVEAVDQRERRASRARDIASGFENHQPAAGARIEPAEPRLAVGRERQCLRRALDPQDRGIGSRRDDRVQEQLVVVLTPDPALLGDRRRGEQRQQLGGQIGTDAELLAQARCRIVRLLSIQGRGTGARPVVHRPVAEAARGHVGLGNAVGRDRGRRVAGRGYRSSAGNPPSVEHTVEHAEPP